MKNRRRNVPENEELLYKSIGEFVSFILTGSPSFFVSEDNSNRGYQRISAIRKNCVASRKGCTRGLGMCLQRAKRSFLYKKALLATLRRRALTPSKMVPREGRGDLDKRITNIIVKIKLFRY